MILHCLLFLILGFNSQENTKALTLYPVIGDKLSGINGTTLLRNRRNWLNFVKSCGFYAVPYMKTQEIAWRDSGVIHRMKKKILFFIKHMISDCSGG